MAFKYIAFNAFNVIFILVFTFDPLSSFALENLNQPNTSNCGNKYLSIQTIERISYISLVSGFGFIFLLTLFDKRIIKLTAGLVSMLAFVIWSYIYFAIDYNEIRKVVFNYNLQAENTLNNIAEAQDRYKSEQGVYLNDLNKLHSHVAGASGTNRCVIILDIKVFNTHWTASAKQVSSPDIIYWDSRKGSSLKKG